MDSALPPPQLLSNQRPGITRWFAFPFFSSLSLIYPPLPLMEDRCDVELGSAEQSPKLSLSCLLETNGI